MISAPQATSVEMVNSYGYGNYNSMYVTWRARDWHHMTVLSTFTYSKALGTATEAQYNSSYTQLDAFNIGANYGPDSLKCVGWTEGSATGIDNNFGGSGVGTNNTTGIHAFANPSAVLAEFRRCLLGYDTSCGGYSNLVGFPTWNLDAAATKDVTLFDGKIGATFSFTFTNVLNHFQVSNPSLSLTSPTSFGKESSKANTPRNAEFGIRIHF